MEVFSQDIVAFFIIRRNKNESIPRDQRQFWDNSELGTPVNWSVRKRHVVRSLGTPHPMEDEDKRRHLDRAYHSSSSPPRNHTTVRSSRRSVEHTKLIAICFEQENTYSFSQFALFNQYFRNPWANPQGNQDNRKTRPVCVQKATQKYQLHPTTSFQEIRERPRTWSSSNTMCSIFNNIKIVHKVHKVHRYTLCVHFLIIFIK